VAVVVAVSLAQELRVVQVAEVLLVLLEVLVQQDKGLLEALDLQQLQLMLVAVVVVQVLLATMQQQM
jgi:hypothetical protein